MSTSVSVSVIYTLSLPPGYTTYSATTLSAPLTTILSTTSLVTTEGRILTTTTPVATVLPAGATLIFGAKPPEKKPNLVIPIAASLGGFIGIVLIIVGIIWWRRYNKNRKRPKPVPPSPRASTHNFNASVLHHQNSSISPYNPGGYRLPGQAQPHHDPHLMSERIVDGQNNVVLTPLPQQSPMSEKRRNMLQRNQLSQQLRQQQQNAAMTSRPSIDDTASSIISQPYTTTNSSVISSGVPVTAAQQYAQQHGQRPMLGHQHQRSLSANSNSALLYTADGRSASPMTIRSAEGGESPSMQRGLGPSPSYFANPNHPQGMQMVREEEMFVEAVPMVGPDGQYYVQDMNPRQSVVYAASQPVPPQHPHGYPQSSAPPLAHQRQYQPQYAASSSNAVAGGSSNPGVARSGSVALNAVVDDGHGPRVVPPKNSDAERNRRRLDGDLEVEERVTNLPELPPTYESVQQSQERRRGGSI